MSVDYSGSILKLDRAETHINEIDFIVYHFLRNHDFTITQKLDFGTDKFGFEIALNRMPPISINPILGDAVHNLRASLDLCVSAVAAARGGNIDNTYFPFSKFGGQDSENMIARRAKEAGEVAMQICREIKPYSGGNDALWGLHQADIADKHKALIVTAAFGAFGVRYLPKGVRRSMDIEAKIHYLNLDPTFVAAPGGYEFDRPDQFGLSVDVVFPEAGPLAGYPVVATLYALLGDVRWIVEQFQKRCP